MGSCIPMLLTSTALLLFALHGVAARQKVWGTEGYKVKVDGSELCRPAQSQVSCASQCLAFPQCISWAFDTELGTCYLHPTLDPASSEAGRNALLYFDTAPACKPSDIPHNLTVVTWQRTLVSFDAHVISTCYDDDFMYDAHVICRANGQWETARAGDCKQRIWRNFTTDDGVFYPLPLTPTVGWSLCLTATPLNTDRFGFAVWTNSSDVIFQFDARFDYSSFVNTTVFSYKIDGQWAGVNRVDLQAPDWPFPFAVGQQFDLKLTITSEDRLQIYVGGSNYGASRELLLPLSTVTELHLHPPGGLQVATFDIFCL